MGKFEGKRLLVLGTSVGSVDIVKYAQSEGAYVYVVDYLEPEKSAAKLVADENDLVSTTDVEELISYAKDKKIDGVFCGVSEVNLASVQKVAEALDLPCYFTREQWDICQDKQEFHDLCIKYNLPVPKKYDISEELTDDELSKIEFPVIVKPVDQGAGVGIHICRNREELKDGCKDAYKKSYKHEIIVEDYIEGDEFSAAYNVIDGECQLSIIGDKYLNREQEGLLPLPDAYVYPSKHIERYIELLDESMKKIIKDLGLTNGTIFFQGITNGEKFYFFEAGLRRGGTALYRFVSQVNNSNVLHYLTDYALVGRIDGDIKNEDPRLKGKRCCLLSLLNKGGKIHKICGVEEASKFDGVVETVVRYNEGDTILRSGTLKQSHIRFFVVCDTAEELVSTIKKIQKTVSVLDENGEEMIISRFDANKLMY